MRLGQYVFALAALSLTTGCSLLEDYLASAIEHTVVPSAIAETMGAVTQNVMSMNNMGGIDIDICQGAEIPMCDSDTGSKSMALNNCNAQEPFTFNGSLKFSYFNDPTGGSNPQHTCDISTTGGRIERSFAATLKGYDSVTIQITDENLSEHPDFPAHGVQVLTHSPNPDPGNPDYPGVWTYSSSGIHRKGTIKAGILNIDPLNLSTRTTEGFEVMNNHPPTSLTVKSGGRVEIYNHSKNYSAELEATTDLIYSNCNCPTQGKLEGVAVGSGLSGSDAEMSLEFTQCGVANFIFRGKTHENVSLDMCVSL